MKKFRVPEGFEVRLFAAEPDVVNPVAMTWDDRGRLWVAEAYTYPIRAPEGNGNVLLQIDKDTGQPRSRVDLGKEREPVYAVDDISGMLFLRTTTGTVVGYRL